MADQIMVKSRPNNRWKQDNGFFGTAVGANGYQLAGLLRHANQPLLELLHMR
jgi:hypothetical protein